MRTLPIKIWHEFQSVVAALSDEAPLRKVLEVILLWVRSNHKHLTGKPFSVYGVDSFANLDEKEIPVEYSSFKKVI
ncbi:MULTISPECIES: hypothetical protein [unclassified Pseudomonas]|uniref:hypothetical protein n=1 Tax=unclassified Pseudomonas TaxID=196821 RepID=UPI0021C74DDA|nr:MULTISPECIES: hypothetical protein [unclassified Pseudomonas]MCU1731805.1 hypothetical protein [Pseudomonas sp. 20P_3.2_Bac4]MCU1743087.1 hypothetical protein [Pseudomonas sp. 20P_3.2_Bac5]